MKSKRNVETTKYYENEKQKQTSNKQKKTKKCVNIPFIALHKQQIAIFV